MESYLNNLVASTKPGKVKLVITWQQLGRQYAAEDDNYNGGIDEWLKEAKESIDKSFESGVVL